MASSSEPRVTNEHGSSHGFTIVELLIVVVVIAILAAVTIVTYNGIQNRAYASKLSVIARHYKETFLLYKEENGVYPVTAADVAAASTNVLGMCLGKAEGYTHIEAGQRMCRWGQTKFYVDSVLNAKLKKYDPSAPDISSSVAPINLGPVSVGGPDDYTIGVSFMVHLDTTLDGQPHPYWLQYYVPIANGCFTGDVAVYTGSNTWPNLSSGAAAKSTTTRGSTLSSCLIPLPL